MIEWRAVVGFEGLYEVSSAGQVRNARTGHVLKPALQEKGYHQVHLNRSGAKGRTMRLHRIVAIAFIPNPEGLKEVNHLDLDKLNNAVSNLEWASRVSNQHHARALGVYHATTNPRRQKRLSVADVIELRRLYHREGWQPGALAKKFGIVPSCALHTAVGRRRSDIPMPEGPLRVPGISS